jgi:heptosyltransferase-2
MRDLKKILVIQTAFLGDVVLSTGVLEKLHEYYPEAQLDMMVRKGNENLLMNHPFLKNLYIFNKKKKIKSLFENIQKIRSTKYDLVINLQRFMTSGLITTFSGAKHTVGFKKNPLSIFFSERFEHEIDIKNSASNFTPTEDEFLIKDSMWPIKNKLYTHEIGLEDEVHEISRNHKVISQFTNSVPGKPALYPTAIDFDHIEPYKSSPYICIAPASIWFTKQYPAEQWVELIINLRNYKIFLLGAPGDFNLCQRIKGKADHSDVVVLAGKISLLQSAALMKDAFMNYVNDSAPMHLASAVNAPVTAVYCSTIPGFGFGPLSDNSFVVETLESLNCRPCGLHGHKACPENHFRCAKTIKTEQLLNSLENYEG